MKKAIIFSLFLLSSIMSKAQFTLTCDASGRCNYTFVTTIPPGSTNHRIGFGVSHFACGGLAPQAPNPTNFQTPITYITQSFDNINTFTGTIQLPEARGNYGFRLYDTYNTASGPLFNPTDFSSFAFHTYCPPCPTTIPDIRILKMDLSPVGLGPGNIVPAGDYYVDYAANLNMWNGIISLSLRQHGTTTGGTSLTPIGSATPNGDCRWKIKVNIPSAMNVKLRFQNSVSLGSLRLWPGTSAFNNYNFQ